MQAWQGGDGPADRTGPRARGDGRSRGEAIAPRARGPARAGDRHLLRWGPDARPGGNGGGYPSGEGIARPRRERGDVRPAHLERRPESARVRLDVRADLRAGREPFSRIMAVVDALPPDGVLILRAPFEPVPLYRVLGRRGFAHWADCLGADDWLVWFFRSPEPGKAMPGAAVAATPSDPAVPPGTSA